MLKVKDLTATSKKMKVLKVRKCVNPAFLGERDMVLYFIGVYTLKRALHGH